MMVSSPAKDIADVATPCGFGKSAADRLLLVGLPVKKYRSALHRAAFALCRGEWTVPQIIFSRRRLKAYSKGKSKNEPMRETK
jgi:hypothetical protein